MAMLQYNNNRGVTIMEVMFVVAIMALLATIVSSPFTGFRQQQTLNAEVEKVTTVINRARIFTISGKGGGVQYGVHFDDSTIPEKVVIYKTTYNAIDPANEVYNIDPAIDLMAPTINGGGSDILFDYVSGATSKNGTTTLRVAANTMSSSTIVINPSGVITIR